jgi:hypothetical protein
MNQELSQEQINDDINLINNIIKRKSPNDYISVFHNILVGGDANLNININDIAKSKNIDPKKMNFIIAYLGETNNINGNFKFNAYTNEISKCIENTNEIPKCIENTNYNNTCSCPTCQQCSSNMKFYLIICFLIIIIIVIIFLKNN